MLLLLLLLNGVLLLASAGAGEESHAERMVGSGPPPSAMLSTWGSVYGYVCYDDVACTACSLSKAHVSCCAITKHIPRYVNRLV